jgi:Tol biopolymer transport system component
MAKIVPRLRRCACLVLLVTLAVLETFTKSGDVEAQSLTSANLPPRFAAIFIASASRNEEIEIAAIIKHSVDAALARAGFEVVSPPALPANSNLSVEPPFPDLRVLNLRYLVTGRATSLANEKIRIEFRLWDVERGQHLRGVIYHVGSDVDRESLARRVANDISERLFESP